MLRLLTEFSGDSREADSLANVLVAGKPLGRKSYGRLNEWSHDPGAWDRARIRMGERIEALIKTGKE